MILFTRRILEACINFILPHRCIFCAEFLVEDNGLCGKCFSSLNFITRPFCEQCGTPFAFAIEGKMLCGRCIIRPPKYDIARSLWKFDLMSKKLIHRFKYNDYTSYAKFFAQILTSRYQQEIAGHDLIIPVPMNRYKRLFRQYNPPQVLADALSREINIPMLAGGLIKLKWTKAQTYLSKNQRQENLKGSIIVNNKYDFQQQKIILVDDVRTTGSTAEYCARCLKNAGATQVTLLTICSA